EVAKAALRLYAVRQVQKGITPPRANEPRQARVEHGRIVELGHVRHPNRPVAAIRAVAAQRPIGLSERRHLRNTGNRLASIFQTDQRGPNRDAADEVARAVDRIDDPAITGCARLFTMFFSEETVAGKSRQESRAKQSLGLAVGQGNRALV